MRLIITTITIFLSSFIEAQVFYNTSVTEGAQQLEAQFLTNDSSGNYYVSGVFSGETLFNSASKADTSITKYSSTYTVSFITKYDKSGKVGYVIKLGGWMGAEPSVLAMYPISNGCLLAYLYCNYTSVTVFDKNSNKTELRNAEGFLVCITKDGMVKWTKAFNASYLSRLLPGSGNSIIGISSYTSTTIYLLDSLGNTLKQINEKGISQVDDVRKFDTNYYALCHYGNNEIGLAKISFSENKVLKPVYQIQIPYKMGTIQTHGVLDNDTNTILYITILKDSCLIDRHKFSSSDGSIKFIKLNKHGRLLKYVSLNVQNYVTSIHVDNNTIYLSLPIQKAPVQFGDTTIVPEKHDENINEVVYAAMTDNLKWLWAIKGGGSWKRSDLVPVDKTRCIALSTLYDYVKLGNDSIAPKWKTSYYVTHIDESKINK